MFHCVNRILLVIFTAQLFLKTKSAIVKQVVTSLLPFEDHQEM